MYGYFAKEYQIPEIPTINIPSWTIIKLIPETYYCKESRFNLDVEKKTILKEEVNIDAVNTKKKNFNFY